MPTEKDLIRRLIEELQELEIDRDSISFVLAAMRTIHPEFPASELLEEARQQPQFRDSVLERYKRLLDLMDLADAKELFESLPPSKYFH